MQKCPKNRKIKKAAFSIGFWDFLPKLTWLRGHLCGENWPLLIFIMVMVKATGTKFLFATQGFSHPWQPIESLFFTFLWGSKGSGQSRQISRLNYILSHDIRYWAFKLLATTETSQRSEEEEPVPKTRNDDEDHRCCYFCWSANDENCFSLLQLL